MKYQDFLKRIIDEGIEAAKTDYADERHKCEGAVAGFNACRDKDPPQLAALLQRANKVAHRAMRGSSTDRYWRLRCFASEVEWVCNVVSAAFFNMGIPPIIHPTTRGMMKAADILGVMSKGDLH